MKRLILVFFTFMKFQNIKKAAHYLEQLFFIYNSLFVTRY